MGWYYRRCVSASMMGTLRAGCAALLLMLASAACGTDAASVSNSPSVSIPTSPIEMRVPEWKCETIRLFERVMQVTDPAFVATEANGPRYSAGYLGRLERIEGDAGPALRPSVVGNEDDMVGPLWKALDYSIVIVWSPAEPSSTTVKKLFEALQTGNYGEFKFTSNDLGDPPGIHASGTLGGVRVTVNADSESDSPGSLAQVSIDLGFEISASELETLKVMNVVSSTSDVDDQSVSGVAKSCPRS